MSNETIMDNNRNYWNENADLWFGTTALPEYGVKFVTEDDLHLFGNISCRTKCRGIMGGWISPKSFWIMRNPYYQKMVMPQS